MICEPSVGARERSGADSGGPIALDTSVIIAALLENHEHHERAFDVVRAALATGAILPLPALLEAYAVMTRLPPPLRLPPQAAMWLLRTTFEATAELVAAARTDAWPLIDGLASSGISGGATFDAHIVLCARLGGASKLATFNARHFRRLDLGGIELLEP